MNGELGNAEVLRFTIGVDAAAYQTLVAGLREPDGMVSSHRQRRSPRRDMLAAIDLDLSSGSYSVSSLGRHRLPTSLGIRPGTRTHTNISGVLATTLREQKAPELASLIEQIIDATPEVSSDLVQLFREDIEFTASALTPSTERAIHTIELAAIVAPTLLLELDESPTLIVPDRPDDLFDDAVVTLQREAKLNAPWQASVDGNTATFSTEISIPCLPHDTTVDIFMHWGSYETVAPAWQDEPIGSHLAIKEATLSIDHSIHVPHHGHYGATLFLRPRGSNESIWLGRFGSDNANFHISSDDIRIATERATMIQEIEDLATGIIDLSLQNPHTLDTQIETIRLNAPHLGLGALVKEVCDQPNTQSDAMELITSIISENHSSYLPSIVKNFGIGEVVFTTPEGTHAGAGGLAQVMAGLPPELCSAGIPVTIISPLYAFHNGNKHPSGQHLLTHGVQLGAERIIPRYIGSITVNLGPTYHLGTTNHRRSPSAIPIKVFLAQSGNLRLFLLSNSSVFDRLYQPVYADEQLRRAVVFSRATLETIATSHFGIRPSAIISNDWMTACVPAFAALDPHYRDISWLRDCRTIHMIHNGGADYHGRLPIHVNNEDLWPLLNIAPEHYFGFRDPHNYNLINFTMAASHHVSGAILTVSPPYARQISHLGGGDGIDYVLQHRRSRVFGISNGINRADIDRYLASLSDLSPADLRAVPTILEAKRATKSRIQSQFGLSPRGDARLISFVGRMAEQKGLSLLSGFIEGGHRSALEDLLMKHEDIQILFAGPPTDGDRSAHDLWQAVSYLAPRYPGRIAVHLDYVAHSKALEIIFGSSFFLMPSRFEPGGITQLESLAAGTLVIGRNVGGISATIGNFNSTTNTGNGFLCNDFTPTAFANTAHWALDATKDPHVYFTLVHNAISAEHSWTDRVPAYQAMLQNIILGDEQFASLPWNHDHKAMVSTLQAG